jgi:FkbM family methyltransferase
VIVDVGSHIGLAALDFRCRWPAATVYAMEPDPIAFATLAENARDDGQLRVFNVAVGGTDGEREFYSSAATFLSGFIRRDATQRTIKVPTRSLDSLIKELGIGRLDVLKLDVEGAEDEVLAAFRGLSSVPVVIGELHTDLAPSSPKWFFSKHFAGRRLTVKWGGATCTFLAVQEPPV